MGILAGSFGLPGVLELFVFTGLAVLNLVATVKIITKAGYSGWWILVPLSPIVMSIITFAVFVYEVRTSLTGDASSFNTTSITGLWVLDVVCGLLSWVFFLIFAFAEWPMQRQARALQARHPGPFGMRQSVVQGSVGLPVDEAFPPASKGREPGWYPVDGSLSEQVYWDGAAWTGRRRWGGASWVEE
jgi:hypothetical protein